MKNNHELAQNATRINVASGNPWRDTRGRFDGDPFDFLKDRGSASFVTREDNEKKIKAQKKAATAALKTLREQPNKELDQEAEPAAKTQQQSDASVDTDKENDKKKNNSAIMSQDEARKAAEGGALAGRVFFHGTDKLAGEKIAEKGFQKSTGENQVFGEGVYLTQNAIEAQGYAQNKAFEDNTATTVSAYIAANKVFTEEDLPPIADAVLERMVSSGIIEPGANLSTFEQFRAWDDIYREVVTELLKDYDAVEIPGTTDRPSYILVKDPSSIKIFEVDDAKLIADEYFEGAYDE